VNSAIRIEPMVVDVWAGNIEQLIDFEGKRPSLILDGTDNVQTRYLLNDVSVKFNIPWIHAACVGTEGRVMVIEPGRGGKGACLRCVFPTPPAAGELPTCDTAGVLQAAAAATASLQGAQAIKLLTCDPGISPSLGTPGEGWGGGQRLWKLDIWSGRFTSIDLSDARHADCPCCGRREFPFLSGDMSESALTLCGRNAVQIRPAKAWGPLQFEQACRRLGTIGRVESGVFFTRCRLDDPPGVTITCFRDGRLLIDGTADAGRAKSICARYLGA
jgi:adenylyltransferase/sulfurtransferase